MNSAASNEATETSYNATIQERGNGFPDVGDYVPGDDGELYIVRAMSRIHTGQSSGASNYVFATVELADWDDIAEDAEHPSLAIIEGTDSDAQCPIHGCSRWRCDESH